MRSPGTGRRRERRPGSGEIVRLERRRPQSRGEEAPRRGRRRPGTLGVAGRPRIRAGPRKRAPGLKPASARGPPTRPDPAGPAGRRARTSPASADPSRTGSPTWRSAAKEAARARERGRIDAHKWKRRRLGRVIADAHVRRRAAFRVAVGRRTRGRRRRSRGAVRREEGNHPGGLIGRRARDEREGDEREEGHETVGGSADAPAVAASAGEAEADETGPAPSPVCGVSLSSSARGIHHITRRYDAVVERRLETCM